MLFGDGAGAAILGPTDDPEPRRPLHPPLRDGRYAEKLWVDGPGLAHDPVDQRRRCSRTGGTASRWKGARSSSTPSTKMPRVGRSWRSRTNGLTTADIKLLIPHQANLRIIEMVQKRLGLRDDQVYNNIQNYGNTTAASIPIALHEALARAASPRAIC